jgi:diadenosine tetraphosphate (Ap4A) HIT family hydrolase
MSDAPNATIAAFGYPRTLVAEYPHWVVLLRPRQVTLGSLVLACRAPVTGLGEIGPDAAAGLGRAVKDIEATLKSLFAYDKINYLMLMMVDPHVHFHVVPRYAGPRQFAGQEFKDANWPKPPDVTQALALPDAAFADLLVLVRSGWRRA